jgi:Domain of unknown function (DUF4157)
MHDMARIPTRTVASRAQVPTAPRDRHRGVPQRATIADIYRKLLGGSAEPDRAGRSAVQDDLEFPSTLAGRRLEPALQAEMGARFAHDFSQVRVHDDPGTHAAASAHGARAYTRGTDIFFGEGNYQPHGADGRRLLAHELAHVIQQSSVSSSTAAPGRITASNDATETEAERAAGAVTHNRTPEVAARLGGGPVVQRQGKGGGAGKAPASMSIANVTGPTAADCGGFSWQVNFNLPSASPAGGYFVQDVKVTRSPTDCAGTATAACKLSHHFWESWRVKPGATQDELVDNGTYTFADQFSLSPCGVDSKGSFDFAGSVSFYEGLALPASFIASNPATIAGALPSTATDPKLAGGTPALTHSIAGTWDCCPRGIFGSALPQWSRTRKTVITGHTP